MSKLTDMQQAKQQADLQAYQQICLGMAAKATFVCQHGTGAMACDCCAEYYAEQAKLESGTSGSQK